jgi:hypothetical protein
MKPRLKSKWMRVDGWTVSEYHCITGTGLMKLTLYSAPTTKKSINNETRTTL